MAELGVVGIPVVALAKRFEEVFVPGESEPREVPRGSEALYLLQRIRDEAHRFAVGYQRTRRSKRMTESLLDALPGVGPVRRNALLRQFGSTRRLLEASPEDIASVPGIGPELAGRIHESLVAQPPMNGAPDAGPDPRDPVPAIPAARGTQRGTEGGDSA
jgi:excinuclease ABC subunit C